MTTIKISNKRSRQLNDKADNSGFQTSVFMEFQMDVLRQCAEIPDFFLPVVSLAHRNAWPAPLVSRPSCVCRASRGRSLRHSDPAQSLMLIESVSPLAGSLCDLNTTGRAQPARPENPAWLSTLVAVLRKLRPADPLPKQSHPNNN